MTACSVRIAFQLTNKYYEIFDSKPDQSKSMIIQELAKRGAKLNIVQDYSNAHKFLYSQFLGILVP